MASKASHRRAALLNTAANTGWTSVGELEMTRRISAVAVCCSSASLRALVISAYDGAGGPLGLAVRGVPHAPQNVACGRFSCWHRGHRIPSVSRVRIVSGRPGTPRHGTRAAAGARRPGRSVGHGRPDPTPTRPRAPDGRFWGVVRPGACGETPSAAPTSQNSRLRHAPDRYTPSWRLGPAPLEPPVESADGDAVAPPRDRALTGRLPDRLDAEPVELPPRSPGRQTRRGRNRPRGPSGGPSLARPGSVGRPDRPSLPSP